jgi:hypothetical protein
MALHLVKMCVGVERLEELADWQRERLAEARARGEKPILRHITRNVPRRADELLAGGSLYWVFRGHIRVRQALRGIEPAINAQGQPACALILDPTLVRVVPKPQRAFQGWRYLEGRDAPADAKGGETGVDDLPDSMAEELRELGLL